MSKFTARDKFYLNETAKTIAVYAAVAVVFHVGLKLVTRDNCVDE